MEVIRYREIGSYTQIGENFPVDAGIIGYVVVLFFGKGIEVFCFINGRFLLCQNRQAHTFGGYVGKR